MPKLLVKVPGEPVTGVGFAPRHSSDRPLPRRPFPNQSSFGLQLSLPNHGGGRIAPPLRTSAPPMAPGATASASRKNHCGPVNACVWARWTWSSILKLRRQRDFIWLPRLLWPSPGRGGCRTAAARAIGSTLAGSARREFLSGAFPAHFSIRSNAADSSCWRLEVFSFSSSICCRPFSASPPRSPFPAALGVESFCSCASCS